MGRMTKLAISCVLGMGILLLFGCGRPEPAPVPGPSLAAPAPDPGAAPAGDAPEPCRLSMGWDPWPPFHFIDHHGELTGFDVEIVSVLAEDVGCDLDFVRDSWVNLLAGVREGSISLVTGATQSPEREEYAHFSAPVRLEEFALFFRTGEEYRWSGASLAELLEQGMRVGITEAYDYGNDLNATLESDRFGAQVTRARFGEANVSRLMELEIDGFLEDHHAAQAMIRRLGLKADVQAHPMALGRVGEVRIMFSRVAVPEELAARIDESLLRLKASGAYAAVEARYFE